MTVRTRILETAAGLLAQSADADVSTRAVCDAAGVTAPTLYHHFGDKDGLLAAVVDFGWAAFLRPSAPSRPWSTTMSRTISGRAGTTTWSSLARTRASTS